VWLEENTLPIVVLGVLCDVLFRISSLACLQPEVPLRPATCSGSMSVSMLSLLAQVTAPTPHTTGRLLAVRLDMAELLA
jgi:hypothetical protein